MNKQYVFAVFVAVSGLLVLLIDDPDTPVPYSLDPGDLAFFGNYSLSGTENFTSSARVVMHSSSSSTQNLSVSRATILLNSYPISNELFLSHGLHTRINETSGIIIFAEESSVLLFNKVCDLSAVKLELFNSSLISNFSACKSTIFLNTESINIPTSQGKVSRFTFIYNLFLFLQWRGILAQLSEISTNGVGVRIEPWCLIFQKLGDIFEVLTLLFLGFSGHFSFSSLSFTALFKFIIFAVLQSQLVIRVWNEHYPSEDFDSVRVIIRRLYSRIHVSLFFATLLCGIFSEYLPVTVFLYQLYWIPQIVSDVRRGTRNSLTAEYILTMSLTRLWLPVYLWGARDSFVDGRLYAALPDAPFFGFAFFLVLVQISQVGLMFSQKKLGPRWFVPWLLLPHVYNYYRAVPTDPEQGGSRECVICMGAIDLKNGDRTAVTPCLHVFHSTCLDQWLEVKLECPTCRRDIPPIST